MPSCNVRPECQHRTIKCKIMTMHPANELQRRASARTLALPCGRLALVVRQRIALCAFRAWRDRHILGLRILTQHTCNMNWLTRVESQWLINSQCYQCNKQACFSLGSSTPSLLFAPPVILRLAPADAIVVLWTSAVQGFSTAAPFDGATDGGAGALTRPRKLATAGAFCCCCCCEGSPACEAAAFALALSSAARSCFGTPDQVTTMTSVNACDSFYTALRPRRGLRPQSAWRQLCMHSCVQHIGYI